VSYIRLGKFDKAIELLKQAEDIYKRNKELYQEHEAALIYYNAGVLYAKDWERTDEDKALALLLKSFDLNPYDADTHMVLGALYFKRREYKNAEKALWNLITLEREKGFVPASYYNMYASILYKSNKLDSALKAVQQGLEVEEDRQLKFNLMGIYIKKGDTDLAKSALNDIPYNADDTVYLIYKALLSLGADRATSLDQLAEVILKSGVDYCVWINDMKGSKDKVIIIPDTSEIEPDLEKIYKDKLLLLRESNMKVLDAVKKCHDDHMSDLSLRAADLF
jgi:tetratricopeptide (TPR) repeat protein